MVVAIVLDFENKVENIHREGLFVHCRFLFESLIAHCPELRLEIWTFSFNRTEVEKIFSGILRQHPDRVTVNDETAFRKTSGNKIYRLPMKRRLKGMASALVYLVSWNEHYLDVSKRYLKRRFSPKMDYFNKVMLEAFTLCSNAEVVYLPGVIYKLASHIALPKVIAVHDLFTLTHRELFAQDAQWIDEHNSKALAILTDYSKSGATFVCSTSYIAERHIKKYIPSVDSNHVEIIPFPPLIKTFSRGAISKDAIGEEIIQRLPKEYIFYPTQIRPNKNVLLLVKASEHLFFQHGIRLPIVTTGRISDSNQVSAYLDGAAMPNLVVETGNLSDDELAYCYQNATMVVVPTVIEGMGISGQGLEALAIGGVPVVHSIADGIDESLESVKLSRATADLNWFDYDDHVQCAEQIYRAYADRAGTIDKQKGIIEKYTTRTWESVAEEYFRLFLRLGRNQAGNKGHQARPPEQIRTSSSQAG